MNSVSTATNFSACMRPQKASKSAVVVISDGGGRSGRGGRGIRHLYTAAFERPKRD